MTKCCVSEFAVDTRDKLRPSSFFSKMKQAVAIPEQDTVNLLLLNTCLCNVNQ
jgi:hypothetical protein